MKRSPLLIMSAGTLVVATLVAAYLFSRTPAKASSDRAVAQDDGTSAISAENAADVARLRHELNALRAQVGSLQGDLNATRAAALVAPNTADQTPPKDPRTREQILADDERHYHEYMAGVAAAFRQEPVEPRWSAGATTNVRDMIAGDDQLRGAARDVECRGHTCRVVFENDGKSDLNKSLMMFTHNLGETLPSMSAERVDGAEGHFSMVLYLSTRQDGPLP